MDVGKSFAYQFEDKRWISKLGLAAIISLVPILSFAMAGYVVQVIRNVSTGAAWPLPEWDDFGKKFTDGITLIAAGVVYAVPALIVVCLPLGLMLLGGAFSGSSNPRDLGNSIAATGGVLFYCLLCLFVLYALVLSVIQPAIMVMYAREGTFSSCFRVRGVLAMIRQNAGNFFTGWIVYIGGSIGVGLVVGIISTLLGWIPCLGQVAVLVVGMGSGIYLVTIFAHLFGQFAATATMPNPQSPAS